ncbi:MAG: HNH endonuclease, partial [Candidatus Scalindua sp.]
MKCIYCLEDKPNNFFENTEHVLSQSFGKFKNNLTLNKIVCDECNEYFGNHLEIFLGRDTLEGMSRFEHKVKKKHEFKSSGEKSRISIKVDEGHFKGAYACREYSDSEDKIIIKPIPQVGFKKIDGADYVYFPLDEIPDKQYLEKHFSLNAPESITTLGCTSKDAQKPLSEKDITLSSKPDNEFPPS